MNFKYVICPKCKWVHFEVSREYAAAEVKKFNEYFKSLTKKEQMSYYGARGASIKSYEHCMLCQNLYTGFRDATDEEIPFGSTVNPIIAKGD